MPTDVTLQHDTWEDYFTRFMAERPAATVSIEVESPQLGRRVEVSDLRLETLLYDRRDDVFEIAALQPDPVRDAVVRRLIERPVAVRVDSPVGILPTAVEIDGADGVRTTVRMRSDAAFGG